MSGTRRAAEARQLAASDLDKATRALEAAGSALKAREREAAGATRADWLAAREARDRGLDRLAAALEGDAATRRQAFDRARELTLVCRRRR